MTSKPLFVCEPEKGALLLEKERQNPPFPIRELTYIFDGAKEITEKREWIRHNIVAKDVILQSPKYFLNRQERYARSLKVLRQLVFYKLKYNMTDEEWLYLQWEGYNDSFPTMLHEFAFLPFLQKAATEEVQKQLVPLAKNYGIIGAYSQTELGHGSNVQGLETTSTFIKETDEFELHTPTLTSLKWWPGCLGQTATHTIIMARMIIDGKDYGIHPFILQVRCLNTHTPLPGITIGEIGPKLGTDAVDNGYLKLNHVRIPRKNLCMAFSSVDQNGKYTAPAHPKLAYVGMVSVRATIVQDAARNLAQAVTIAVRYSIVRQQFSQKKSLEESSVLNYSMQQYRLFPSLATAYALTFTGRAMKRMFSSLESELKRGEHSLLSEVHAVSSGFKSLTTTLAGEGMEQCRLCCGGHGYTKSSGLPDLYASYIGVVTAEGENYLLTQQTGRYLLKLFQKLMSGEEVKPGQTTEYILRAVKHQISLGGQNCSCEMCICPVKEGEHTEFLLSRVQLAAYQHRTIRLLTDLANDIQAQLANNPENLSFVQIWNSLQVEIYRLSRAHCLYLVAKFFIEAVEEIRQNGGHESVWKSLKTLCDFFILYYLEKDIGEFSQDNYISRGQILLLRKQLKITMTSLRPLALGFVDAFNFSDHQLDSCLGRFDGRVYEALYQYVLDDPSSGKTVSESYKYIRPLIRQEFIHSPKISKL
eukprot:TRINITY_DN1436_c0_g1_i1.p1 TRINITY_DN1436_c0_g1~~TRINITY_DN1436_c0_g1_i1.p1  ORF type:complete len:701 (-),score=144.17 TRINITY_DN1436_c0_g1_i1:48-2150(-)